MIPSAARLRTAVSVGQNRTSARWSVTTRFCSSGIVGRKERRPASTWASGTGALAAAIAPARVVVVSP